MSIFLSHLFTQVLITSRADHELVRTQTGGHEVRQDHLHLQPEPSPDPADPLNFSMFRKITILALMALYAFITNVASSIISSALPDLVTAWLVIGPHGPVIGPHGPEGLVGFSSLTHLIAVRHPIMQEIRSGTDAL